MRLSKADTRTQADIQNLLRAKRVLNYDEIEMVLAKFNPASVLNPTANAAFFTPTVVANDVGVMCGCEGERVLDLAAGIGALSYGILDRQPREIVCVELKPEFVAIGKKLVPQAKWIQGDIFDERLIKSLGKFDWVISNPPFGLNFKQPPRWLKYQGQSDLMAVEIAMKLAPNAIFILPAQSVPWQFSFREQFQKLKQLPRHLHKFCQTHPQVVFGCLSLDCAMYANDWQAGSTRVEICHICQEDAA